MAYIHSDFETFQRKRLLWPDAGRWLRQDVTCSRTGIRAATEATVAHGQSQLTVQQEVHRKVDAQTLANLYRVRFELFLLHDELVGLRLQRLLRKAFPPDGGVDESGVPHYLTQPRVPHYLMQPRVPPGNPDGGQWTVEEGYSGVRVAQANQFVTDAAGNSYYRRGGHHEMSKSVYGKWNLRPETRAVFEGSTTGTVPATIRPAPEGSRQGNFWDGQEGMHGEYNRAVKELSEHFMERNGITPEQMTPNHARALLKEIRETEDPRIRTFNNAIRLIRRLYKLRSGRGLE